MRERVRERESERKAIEGIMDIVGMQKQSKREAKAKLNNINGERWVCVFFQGYYFYNILI